MVPYCFCMYNCGTYTTIIGASAAFTRFVDMTSNPSTPLDTTNQVGNGVDDDDGRRSEGYE